MPGNSTWEDLDKATGVRSKQLAKLKNLYQQYQDARGREEVGKFIDLALEIADKVGQMLLDRNDAAYRRKRTAKR